MYYIERGSTRFFSPISRLLSRSGHPISLALFSPLSLFSLSVSLTRLCQSDLLLRIEKPMLANLMSSFC